MSEAPHCSYVLQARPFTSEEALQIVIQKCPVVRVAYDDKETEAAGLISSIDTTYGRVNLLGQNYSLGDAMTRLRLWSKDGNHKLFGISMAEQSTSSIASSRVSGAKKTIDTDRFSRHHER